MIGTNSKRWISAMLAGTLAIGGALPFYAAGAFAPVGVESAVASVADDTRVLSVNDDCGYVSLEDCTIEGDVLTIRNLMEFTDGGGDYGNYWNVSLSKYGEYGNAFECSLELNRVDESVYTIDLSPLAARDDGSYTITLDGQFSAIYNYISIELEKGSAPAVAPASLKLTAPGSELIVQADEVIDSIDLVEFAAAADARTNEDFLAFLAAHENDENCVFCGREAAGNGLCGVSDFFMSKLEAWISTEGNHWSDYSTGSITPPCWPFVYMSLDEHVDESFGLNTAFIKWVLGKEAPAGVSYTAIKVFDANVTGDHDAEEAPKASYVKYADGVESVFTTDDETMNPQLAAEEIAENIKHQPADGLAAGSYGKELAKKLIAAGADTTEVFADADGYVDLPGEGYYLIVKTDSLEGENTAATSPIFAALKAGENTIMLKTAIPSLTKEIKEDSTGEWGAEADHSLYQVADYRLVGTVAANVDAYDTYPYSFVDTFNGNELGISDDYLTGGMDESVVKVSVDGIDVTDQATVFMDGADVNAAQMTVSFANLKGLVDENGDPIEITADTEVVVEYSVIHTNIVEDAVNGYNSVSRPDGIVNSARLEYANNPMVEDSKGTTPEVTTRDYSYALQIHKTDNGTGEDLQGVEFSIKNSDGKYLALDDSMRLREQDEPYMFVTDADGMVYLEGVDADDYIVVEEQELPGYAALDDSFTVSMDVTDRLNPGSSISTTVADLVAGEDSDEAAAYISVKNVKEIGLPSTGEMGVGIAVLIAIGLGVYAIARRNRKDEAEVMHV